MFFLPSSGHRLDCAESARPPIAFIVGCARSGTSILGELIAAHPSVKYVFEATKVWESIGRRADGSHRLTAGNASWRVRHRIRREFTRCHGHCEPGGIVIEKCPRNTLRIPFLHRVFPQAKFIHIIRDGRDVACSLVPGLASGRWQHLRPPGWQAIEQQFDGAARCAMAWRAVVEHALQDLRDVPHIEVRYEDLVRDPAGTAQAILNYLHLDPSRGVDEFAHRIQDQTDGSYQARFQVQWFRDDHARRIGRWRENLSLPEQQQVNAILEPMLRRLGYRDVGCSGLAKSYSPSFVHSGT